MFRIDLVDIGGDNNHCVCKSDVDTLFEVELKTQALLRNRLGTEDIELVHDDELVYDVIADGRNAGTVAFRSL